MADRQVRGMGYFVERIWRRAARISKTQLAASGRTMQDPMAALEVQGMRRTVDKRDLRYIRHVWGMPEDAWPRRVMMGRLEAAAESEFSCQRGLRARLRPPLESGDIVNALTMSFGANDRRGRDQLCKEVGRRGLATAGIRRDMRVTALPECGKGAANKQQLPGHL